MQGYEENIKADKLNHSTYIARTTFQLAGYYLTKQNKKAALSLENSLTGLVSSSLRRCQELKSMKNIYSNEFSQLSNQFCHWNHVFLAVMDDQTCMSTADTGEAMHPRDGRMVTFRNQQRRNNL